jgi:hypothetical protein
MSYYDRQGNPLSFEQWVEAYETRDVVVKQSRHNERGRDIWLSTVWLGLDHSFGGPPLIFETMTFHLVPPEWNSVHGDKRGEEQRRYTTEAEALAGHDPWEMTRAST